MSGLPNGFINTPLQRVFRAARWFNRFGGLSARTNRWSATFPIPGSHPA